MHELCALCIWSEKCHNVLTADNTGISKCSAVLPTLLFSGHISNLTTLTSSVKNYKIFDSLILMRATNGYS